MAGADLVLRPEERAVHGLELAEQVFTPERRLAISKFLNVRPDDPALLPYLATCASYGLDPVMGQIWLIPQKVKVRDGDATETVERYRPAVGRDGFLAIAHREPRYRGLKGQVVCEFDTFEVEYDGSDHEPKILHRFASKPTTFEEGVDPSRWRGRVLGSWAKCEVHGQPDTFFFAPIREYVQMREVWEGPRNQRRPVLNADGSRKMEITGAWRYLSSMSLKAAQSYVLRIGLGISGLVPADELVGGVIDSTAQEVKGDLLPGSTEGFDFTVLTSDGGLAHALSELVGRVNELAPLSWPPAKVEMVMGGMGDAELRKMVERLEHEVDLLERRKGRAAPVPAATHVQDEVDRVTEAVAAREEAQEAVDADQPDPAAEEVLDADVVPDDGPRTVAPENAERLAGLDQRKADLEETLNDPFAEEREKDEASDELKRVEEEMAALENPDQGGLFGGEGYGGE